MQRNLHFGLGWSDSLFLICVGDEGLDEMERNRLCAWIGMTILDLDIDKIKLKRK